MPKPRKPVNGKKPVAPKVHLANLFGVMRMFKPEMLADSHKEGEAWTGKFLVNERCGGPVPERDDLLRLIGNAALEMNAFSKEHSMLCAEHNEAIAAMMRMSAKLDATLGEFGEQDIQGDINDRLEILTDRYRQALGVINNIANNVPADKCKAVAEKFLKFKPGQLIVLEVPNDPAKPQDSPTKEILPESQPDQSGDDQTS